MKFVTDPIVNTAKDAVALSGRLLDDGVDFLRTSVGKVPLFAGARAYLAEDGLDADETHYFLVPFRPADRGFALATARVLPEGVGPENELAKRRVFHLPDGVSREALENLLEQQLAEHHSEGVDGESQLAARLDEIAGEIDAKSNLVTGGLLVIGGAVAIANPVVGAGIAAKALLPGVGGVLSKMGFKAVSDRLRTGKLEKVRRRAEKEAEKEVKRLSAIVHRNDLLSAVERAVSTADPGDDPHIDRIADTTPAEMRLTSITAGAVLEVYADILRDWPADAEEARLHPNDRDWLLSLREVAEGRRR